MEAWEGAPATLNNNRSTNGFLPQFPPKAGNPVDDNMGFSHGAFNLNSQNVAGYGNRHPRRANVPAINTGSTRNTISEMATPPTGLDMQFTPLLPSQLLLGSPFQPGSPSTFASPRFSSISTFQPQNPAPQQTRQNQMGAPVGQGLQHPMSPQPISAVMPSTGFAGPHLLSPQSPVGGYMGLGSQGMGLQQTMMPGAVPGTSRTVYLGNIPPETSAEEILGHVRSGQIESVRLLPDKNCAFISFLDGSSAMHFHSDAILKKLSIRGHDIKVGWGKPSHVPTSVALAVQQSGASRNVYLGNLPENITEQELREDLGKFGPIDTIKLVREKSIGFVHFLSIGNAIKAVTHLPQEPKWQAPRRVYYGKDRCAYVSKTQQQNAAQYLGIAPGYAHALNGADRQFISNAIAQQSVAAAAVATSAGGIGNLGNRTVYLGNIHPETTIEEICNVVRGGLLHHIRYIPDKHICFVTFIDPTSAASFYALSHVQGLMIHNRRLKIGWGKHSGSLPPAIALAVSGGASRNVYVGNLDETWTEERLRQDFADYGDIELVNTLREKSCAFVNFTNIANAIKAIEGIRGREEYRRFKINFGKDRCGNPPRQGHPQKQQQQQPQYEISPNGVHENVTSPHGFVGLRPPSSQAVSVNSPTRGEPSPAPGSNGATSSHSPQHMFPNPHSAMLQPLENNPLTLYLNQLSLQQQQQAQTAQQMQESQLMSAFSQQQQQQQQPLSLHAGSQPLGLDGLGGEVSQAFMEGAFSNSNNNHHNNNVNKASSSTWTIGGLLAPSNTGPGLSRGQHARAISLPVFSQDQNPGMPSGGRHQGNHVSTASTHLSAFGGFGLALNAGLPGWTEEEVAAQ
ncbi:MAG: hypothetical protein M1823_004257 [Watsoniomyces obsoletus]|nr:MAG: hypothetical protein M1823_004257 [Watsoniomyces obsoletus]